MEEYTIVSGDNFSRLKSDLDKIKEKNQKSKIIFSGKDDEFNRQVLEKAKVDALLINLSERKDFSKQRNSGLNSVLAEIAKKRDIKIGINFDELRTTDKKEKARILSRIIQNIAICKKKKIKMMIFSKEKNVDKLEFKTLGLSLGMPTWMTKEI